MTTKLQTPEVAEVEAKELPNIDTAIAAEVAKQLKDERTALREDLMDAALMSIIEMCADIRQALAPKAEITLTAAPAGDNDALRKALATIPKAKRDSIKTMADVYSYHAGAKGGK